MIRIIKDTLALTVITLVAVLCLSVVYGATKEIIAEAGERETLASFEEVFPEATGFDPYEMPKNYECKFGSVIHTVMMAKGEDGMAGLVISVSHSGYGGAINVSVGVHRDGTITGLKVLSAGGESPGLGSHCLDASFQKQFLGKGGEIGFVTAKEADRKTDGDIDALSGATITTRGVVNAVNDALAFASTVHYGGLQG